MNDSKESSSSNYSYLDPNTNIFDIEPKDSIRLVANDLKSQESREESQDKSDEILNLSILYNVLSETKSNSITFWLTVAICSRKFAKVYSDKA